MNEDDTFRALKRTPIAQMDYLYKSFRKQYGYGAVSFDPMDKMFDENGWTYHEYRRALERSVDYNE